MPAIRLSRVDLPDPEAPTMATCAPLVMDRVVGLGADRPLNEDLVGFLQLDDGGHAGLLQDVDDPGLAELCRALLPQLSGKYGEEEGVTQMDADDRRWTLIARTCAAGNLQKLRRPEMPG
jgi:hypothetical protein